MTKIKQQKHSLCLSQNISDDLQAMVESDSAAQPEANSHRDNELLENFKLCDFFLYFFLTFYI